MLGTELSGKTLGIIGLGRIGKQVATRALGLEMQVIANDVAPDWAFANTHGIAIVSMEGLLARSDVVTLHVPLTPLTQQMISTRALALIKPGAYLVNVARAPVVDPGALNKALDRGVIAGAHSVAPMVTTWL